MNKKNIMKNIIVSEEERGMHGVEFLSVTISFDGSVTNFDLDEGIGSVSLSCDGREYVLDTNNSQWDRNSVMTMVRCDVEEDRETLNMCNYDLEVTDLGSTDLEATIYMGRAEDIFVSATLFVKIGGCTRAIDLKLEK